MQRAYHNRPLNKPESVDANAGASGGSGVATQSITIQKSPSSKLAQSNLPQIFKKDQKEGKTIRAQPYDIQLKTIFKHDAATG